ncbi:chemotaxis protein CheD [Aquitalea sp. S1-19]|nr:chemotaxis protein CheD [Aquitalea sp. S1-19]MCP9760851.1 chemotaxis protein CheD [Aquitalea sp. S1-19]MCP9760999.1 chemotaxis protein CheD [Aquitalea sp. S1-19]
MSDYAALPPREIERLALNIRPGEWAVERQRPIATLLGSCVAVCLIDTGLPLAGMNHFMLPQMRNSRHADEDMLLAGDACMEALLNAMLKLGAARHRIHAKAFGGGNVIDSTPPGVLSIGKRNADFTQTWLARERIPLLASDFLGPWSRKVLLVPATGDAWCRRAGVGAVQAQALKREEQAYAESLRQVQNGPQTPRVELF